LNWSNQLKVKLFFTFVLLIFSFTAVNAQISPDSLDKIDLNDSVFVMQKSPTGAMLRSALLPGWGQIYNGSYWKAPVIWSLIGYFAYVWTSTNSYYQDYRELYKKSLNQSPNGDQTYLRYREFYRDERDLFTFYIGLTYFLNIIDAYVDAHLFDFDAQFKFNKQTETLRLNFQVNF
jgi:hypothetical protein